MSESPSSSPAERLAGTLQEGETLAVVASRIFLSDLTFKTVRTGNRKKMTETRSHIRIPVAMTDRRMIQLGQAVRNGNRSDYYSKRHPVFALDPEPVESTPWERVRRIDVTKSRNKAVITVRCFASDDIGLEMDVSGDGGPERLDALNALADKLKAGEIGGSTETRKRIEAAAADVEASRRSKMLSLVIAGVTSLVTAFFCAGAGVGGLGMLAGLIDTIDEGMKRGIGRAIWDIGIPAGFAAVMLIIAAGAGLVAVNRWRARSRAVRLEQDKSREFDALVAEMAGST